MSAKPVIPRRAAEHDIEVAIARYLTEGGQEVAVGFIDELQAAYGHIARQPATGSPRYAHELDLPGLRFTPLQRYPYLVFYVERDHHVDVWRVLHEHRDIPERIRDPDDT